MKVTGFMIPAESVATCTPDDTLEKVMNLMLDRKISSVVVLGTGDAKVPIGIVTKTNMLMAYKDKLPLTDRVKEIMSRDLKFIQDSMSKDDAAQILEGLGHHHAIVTNKEGHYVGIISTYDIATEDAKDARAWPFNRPENKVVHLPMTKAA
jgi:CBS domain-containing protein